jgi:hypothetical protein
MSFCFAFIFARSTYTHPQHNIKMAFLPTDFTQVNFKLNQKMVLLEKAAQYTPPNPINSSPIVVCNTSHQKIGLNLCKCKHEVIGVRHD